MSTPKPQNEPTMEEILASIRKIISEDAETPAKPGDAPAAAASGPAAAAPPPMAATPSPAPSSRDDSVLELTDMVKDDGSVEKVKQPSEELMMTDTTAAESSPLPPSAPMRSTSENDLLSSRSAAAAASALAGLAGAAAASRGMALGNGQKTIEDIVRELLRPMLKDWLDANLPPLVERLVQREITKLAGHADDR